VAAVGASIISMFEKRAARTRQSASLFLRNPANLSE